MLDKVYILDDWERLSRGQKGPSRPWRSWITASIACKWDPSKEPPIVPIGNGTCSNGVVLVHWSFLATHFADEVTAQTRLEQVSSASSDLVWIVISGANQGQRNGLPGKLHYRITKVTERREDPFRAYFSEFHRAVRSGSIDFSLLEPEPRPDALLVVQSCLQEGIPIPMPEATWRIAKSQFIRAACRGNGERPCQGSEIDWARDARWPEDLMGTPECLDRFLAVADSVIAELESRAGSA